LGRSLKKQKVEGWSKMEKTVDKNYKLFIDGKWVNSNEDKTFDVFCPANGKKYQHA